MTNTQLYLAIGVPSALFLVNLLVVLWQSGEVEKQMAASFGEVKTKIDSLEKVMNAKFEAGQQSLLRVEGVLDARLKHLEERER